MIRLTLILRALAVFNVGTVLVMATLVDALPMAILLIGSSYLALDTVRVWTGGRTHGEG